MAFLEDLFNKLFPAKNQQKPVAVQEELHRSNNYLRTYEEWKHSPEAAELLRRVKKSYEMKKKQVEGLYPVHLFHSAAANGFALSYHPSISRQEFHYLLDYWRDRVRDLGYRLANTDRQIKDRESYIQTTEKHYLKPPASMTPPKTVQRYGNVLLEYVLIDNQPSYLKLMVTIYSDHLFTQAEPYEELVDYLLEPA